MVYWKPAVQNILHMPAVVNSTSTPEIGSQKLVVIVTYMRSGSSLTGDILQQTPGAFYAYEPFRALFSMNSSVAKIMYANKTVRLPPFSLEHESKMTLLHWLKCELDKLPKVTLMDGFMRYGIKTRTFVQCIKTNKSINNFDKCVKRLKHECKISSAIVLKTIRLTVKQIEYFLGDFPNLKIVHLIRDPRATLSSESRLGQCSVKKGGMLGCTSRYCARVEDDILDVERLNTTFSNRLTQVRYENIAKYPITSAKEIYKFLGFEFNEHVENYIFNITMSGKPDNCLICTTRSNSTQHIDAWKTKMKRIFIDIVNDRCHYLIKRSFEIYPKP
ncbi:hypothetical protein ACF0H5_012265 [Mactra antiquata]